jgi:hypothetical protein
MLVTEADEMTPESSRFNEQRTPAIVQRRKSTFRRRRRSNAFFSEMELSSVAATSSSREGTLYDLSSEMALYDWGSGDAIRGCDEEDGTLSMRRYSDPRRNRFSYWRFTFGVSLGACDCYLQLIITPSEVASSFPIFRCKCRKESGVFWDCTEKPQLRLLFCWRV